MIALYTAACAVSFLGGCLFAGITAGVLAHHAGYQRGYHAATSDRTSRALVRARLAELAVQATRPLPHAQRDHKQHTTIRLVRP